MRDVARGQEGIAGTKDKRLIPDGDLKFSGQAILCWLPATSPISYVILATTRIIISSYFHLPDSRNSLWRRPFPRTTTRLLQRSHLQLPSRTFINLPRVLGSFSDESCQSYSPAGIPSFTGVTDNHLYDLIVDVIAPISTRRVETLLVVTFDYPSPGRPLLREHGWRAVEL